MERWARVPAGPEGVERVAICVADFPSLGDHFVLLPLYNGLKGIVNLRQWLADWVNEQ